MSQPLVRNLQSLDLDAFVDLVFILDKEGRFTLVSDAAPGILGCEPEALLGRLLADCLSEPYRSALDSLVTGCGREHSNLVYECEVLRGETRLPVELSLRPRWAGDEIQGYQGLIREIHQLRQLTEDLQEQKRRFAVLEELSQGLLSRPTLDAVHTVALTRMRTLSRYEDGAVYVIAPDRSIRRSAYQGESAIFPEELAADGSAEALLPETYLIYPRLLDSDNTVSRVKVLDHLRAKGRQSALMVPLSSQGRLLGLVLLATPKHRPLDQGLKALLGQLASQLAQSQENHGLQARIRDLGLRFEDFSESSIDHIWEVDSQGRYTYNSPGVMVLLGYRPEELFGTRPLDLVHEEDREETRRILMEMQKDNAPLNGMVNRLISAEGKQVYVESRAFPIFDNRGEVRGYRGLDHNITDWFESKRMMEETLIGTCEALSRMVELRDPYTKGHSVRVADLVVFLAKAMGRSPYEVQGLHLMGLLHDIGKVGIPTEILSKPGRLAPEEMELMRQHPLMSCEILKEISFPWPVADVVRHHHERMDGSGYGTCQQL